LEVVIPVRPNGAAVLIAAGGGYRRIELAIEARPAAHWLADQGITAFVLSYRLPLEGWKSGPLAPLQDAQRALRIIRARADRYGLNQSRIGVLGFSAGAHLLGLAAARSTYQSYSALDDVDAQPARADVAALIYPVITLEPPYDRTSTRRVLIGDHPTPQASAAWSVETYVGSDCPPVFLVQADDDPISNPKNTLIMADACKRAGVAVEVHQPQTGGHGFGMGKPGTQTVDWPGWYQAWLVRNGMLNQNADR
jgi:acetyl esterase/lipase